MTNYSVFSLIRNAFSHHDGWDRAWRDAVPKAHYDVVIVGAGGHGLATAYYLAKLHGITNVAVIEKGWLGGGNTGRNTTIIRSNYLWDESAALYEKSLQLFEGLSQELNYNVMFSQRGVLNLAHNLGDVREGMRRVNALRLNGIDSEWLTPEEIKDFCPIVNTAKDVRYPIMGGTLQRRGGTARHDAVAWGFARAASAMGVDIIQNCEVTGIRRDGGKVVGVETAKGYIGAGEGRHRRCRPFQRGRCDGGHPPAHRKPPAAGAGFRTDQAGDRLRGDVQCGACLCEPVR